MVFMGILSDTRWVVMAFSAFFQEFTYFRLIILAR
jgi:hypothetical protein